MISINKKLVTICNKNERSSLLGCESQAGDGRKEEIKCLEMSNFQKADKAMVQSEPVLVEGFGVLIFVNDEDALNDRIDPCRRRIFGVWETDWSFDDCGDVWTRLWFVSAHYQ